MRPLVVFTAWTLLAVGAVRADDPPEVSIGAELIIENGALVVANVDEGGSAEKAGLKAGDVITKVGDKKVEDSDDLVSALRDADSKVTLTVMRQKASRTIQSELRDPMVRVRRGPMSYRAPEIRIQRDVPDDVRRELDDLRRELRDLKSKLEEKNRN